MTEDIDLIMDLLYEARHDDELTIDDPLAQAYSTYRRKADASRERLARINAEIARRIPEWIYDSEFGLARRDGDIWRPVLFGG